MTEYWQGFEIDGSDTSFNIVMPERARAAELGVFFSKLPLFGKVYLHLNNKSYSDPKKIEQVLGRENGTNFTIDAECIHPAVLPAGLKESIYSLSERRMQMHEKTGSTEKETETFEVPDYTKAINPSVGLSDFPFEMSLTCEGHSRYHDYQPKGYIINPDNIEAGFASADNMIFSLHCPVSSIYEYFAYVINAIAERFPEISVDGGLDCAGGFLYGCTYSTYLYEYECITLKAHSNNPDSIKQLLEKLVATGTAFPCVRKPVKYTSDYFLAENELTLLNSSNYSKANTMSFNAYVGFLAKEASPKLEDKMKCAVLFLTEKDTNWKNYAQLTAYPDNGQWVAELYIKQQDRRKMIKRFDQAGIEYI